MKTYIFNPEHDLALACKTPHFQPPASAKKFAEDLATLSLFYAEENSKVLVNQDVTAWKMEVENIFPTLKNVKICKEFSPEDELSPWGWNFYFLNKFNIKKLELAEKIKTFSHRKISVEAMDFLRQKCNFKVPKSAEILRSLDDVLRFSQSADEVVFKAPFSGSGRGVFKSKGALTDSVLGWCKRTLTQQGSVLGEIAYDKILDFAMEFFLENGQAKFAGYSIFRTEGMGVYRGNFLMSDEAAFAKLSEYVSPEKLLQVQANLTDFFIKNFNFHNGFLGVDMLIFCDENGAFELNPMIEINLRMTMGVVAHQFFKNFVSPNARGQFFVERFPTPQALKADHQNRLANQPLKMCSGRIESGYFALNPILPDTLYRAWVEVGD